MAFPPLTPSLLKSESYPVPEDLLIPTEEMLAMPEKVLQFGTGGFLRAFADFFIDQANRKGLFNGRIVAVGSTGSKRVDVLNEQQGLYTLRVQGLEHGGAVERFHVLGAISRALSAKDQWEEVLAVGRSETLELIFSNTTEVGITYDPTDRLGKEAPATFPGKLTAVLYERAKTYDYDPDKGVVVLPCELIENNGDVLRKIVLQLIAEWGLEPAFADWVEKAVPFCNTLVDRIVPGTPAAPIMEDIQARLKYTDGMLTTAESYRLWPIEAAPEVQERLTFAEADPAIILTDDVRPFRERKIRILNGTHTACVPFSFLMGEDTVLSMMRNPLTSEFVRNVMMEEIVPGLDVGGGQGFAEEVIERFSNPFLRHRLIDITLQSTKKWRLRLVPTIERFHEKYAAVPHRICLGFAAYLIFVRGIEEQQGGIYGRYEGKSYPIKDDQARYYMEKWAGVDPGDKTSIDTFVHDICSHEPFWGSNLALIPEFVEAVSEYTWGILVDGPEKTLRKLQRVT